MHKLIIYQLLPRLFGNINTTNKFYGSVAENGCGKFNDISAKALAQISSMGFTHVWYTGVIEHATMTDYAAYGITPDDPDVVKGRAGSPYAIRDYYDVAPDLAVDVMARMAEFEALVTRTHEAGLKVIIDFVPNHVARTYQSDAKPAEVRDFGADDDVNQAFSSANDFYYLPGQPFKVPEGYNPGGDEMQSSLKDGYFNEVPAKGTGDDVFTATPSLNNWFETVKLNYGVDYGNGHQTHFYPPPPLWHKTLHILLYWSAKNIDGFRCDMIELVPMEFWAWVIPQVKEKYPHILFIGEAYQPHAYSNYLFNGKFDYLYDKVGLYDSLRRIICQAQGASTWEINSVWNHHTRGFDERMLRFMENHDEQRIASPQFAGNAELALPAMIVTATLHQGPVMVYFGQEVGEPAAGTTGFSTDDGRTTIFDYWGVPEHQKWMNQHEFDGGQLTPQKQQLRDFYAALLNLCHQSGAIKTGQFYELMMANEHSSGFNDLVYIYARYTETQRLLIVANFQRHDHQMEVKLPVDLLEKFNLQDSVEFTDRLSNKVFGTDDIQQGLWLSIPASNGYILEF